ncbi:MAG: hypothetical protein H6Q17_2337 [Bacteroidetes bacterium]|nr:hypothetical protein [Bacteroidota bacterium]
MDINQSMPWIVAFLIGFSSAIINILVSKNQRKISIQAINKDILSKNRQEWINTLRDSVSQYLSSHELSKLIRQYDQKNKNTQPEYKEEFKSWQLLYYKIK